MKSLIILACCVTIGYLEPNVALSNLLECDKVTCLKRLEKAEDAELWDFFLAGQAKLFFDSEFQWILKQIWWQQSERILEIGSGNGVYLSKLSDRFQEKTFQGIEKLSKSVAKANELYTKDNLSFREGDAEVFNAQLINSANIVLFRMTLQHIQDSIAALINASDYVTYNGYVFIIDSCDAAKRTSHHITAIDEALQLVEECQRKKRKGNRKVTLELLQTLETKESLLNELYDVVFSNLDSTGKILCDTIRFEGEKDRKLYFNHSLLFLNLLHRTYQIPIDLDKAYDELQDYIKDEEAWNSPGVHFLVLKRKSKGSIQRQT